MTRACSSCGRVLLVAAIVFGCTAKDQPPRAPLGQLADSLLARQQAHALLGPAAKAALDSGNSLFRKKAYSEALAQYREAADLAPQHSAPLFGIYMVARATNNKAMADSALDGIRRRNGPMPAGPHDLPDTALRRMHEALRKKPATS